MHRTLLPAVAAASLILLHGEIDLQLTRNQLCLFTVRRHSRYCRESRTHNQLGTSPSLHVVRSL